MGFNFILDPELEVPFVVPTLVRLCIDSILKHRLVDDHRLLEATARANAKDDEPALCTKVRATYAELNIDLQHRIMERATEQYLVDDFLIGYFIAGINALGALNIRNCPITDAGLDLLVSGCPTLHSLDVSFCHRITGPGFARLVGSFLPLPSYFKPQILTNRTV
jgi:hypothetical protein